MSLGSRALLLGWRLAGRVPEDVVRAAMHVGAEVAWLLHGEGVRRLEANLARALPGAGQREIRRRSREGMRRYLRYYAETFTLGRLTPEQVLARVRPVGDDAVRAACADGGSAVLALGHQGNWDLAGAWATVHIATVTTVAERLEPAEVFEEFRALREGIGLRIIPLDAGADVFRELVRVVRAGSALVPLLADRDLTARGIEVTLLGERARVAVGPAALAVTTGAPLFATTIRHERLRGAARRAAGSRWGIVLTFVPVATPQREPGAGGAGRTEQVAALTQAWVDVVGADIAAHATDWHMLQRVFLADLDQARLARAAAVQDGRVPGA